MNSKNSAFRAGAALAAAVVLLFSACKTENKKIAELKAAAADTPDSPEILESLMMAYLLDTDNTDEPISIYEKHSALHSNVMANVYYATALCMKAGSSKVPADQLKYVRKGMGTFEDVIARFPEDGRCYVWKAITYSNFPAMLGADGEVLSAINTAESLNAAKSPELAAEELKQLVFAYLNIAEGFENKQYLDAAKTLAQKYGLENDEECSRRIIKAEAKIK
ncbi:MAG: hypothetical protein ACTTKL_05505 [Treponema sp.]